MNLGKLPHVSDPRDFLFADYRTTPALPKHPRTFGHEKLVPTWGMLGNDQYGDCVFAGGDHESMLFNAEAGRAVSFEAANALADYGAVTGFKSSDPNSDCGTNVRDALNYRRQIGLVDSVGIRHKIDAYVKLKLRDAEDLYEAMYLFGAVGIGINFPDSAMDQFNADEPWSVVRGASVDGGHYIPCVSLRGAGLLGPYADSLFGDAAEALDAGATRDIVCVTWGKLQPMTLGFYEAYADEAYALLSAETLTDGKTLEGFDLDQLRADLRAL